MSAESYDEIIVNMTAPGTQLVIRNDKSGPTASVWLGGYPSGKKLSFTTTSLAADALDRAYVYVNAEGEPSFWMARTCFNLPWFELLKVADFLRLPIDVPEPAEKVRA